MPDPGTYSSWYLFLVDKKAVGTVASRHSRKIEVKGFIWGGEGISFGDADHGRRR
jgi:hypothetical protein